MDGDAAWKPVAGMFALPGEGRLRSAVFRVPKCKAVKFQEMVNSLSLEMVYTFAGEFCFSTKRSTIVERFVAGVISRISVLQ
jgi:hypothetical protein